MSEKQRREGFRKAEASLRLEGMDPSGVPRYECLKTRIISGETSYEQGRGVIRPQVCQYGISFSGGLTRGCFLNVSALLAPVFT